MHQIASRTRKESAKTDPGRGASPDVRKTVADAIADIRQRGNETVREHSVVYGNYPLESPLASSGDRISKHAHRSRRRCRR